MNWFDRGGAAYARYRPDYPAELVEFLAAAAPTTELAVDVGCGTGQFTSLLAGHFAATVGADPSADQIRNAVPAAHTRFVVAPAEELPVADRSTSLITAAQAAHWFDRPAFYAEVRRIAVDDAVLALISYGVMRFEAPLAQRFAQFYTDEIGRYWPAERALVDAGYAGIDFPFAEIPTPALAITKTWTLHEVLGYISTWSAVRRAHEAGDEAMLTAFADDFASLWGDAAQARPVSWPIAMRVGRVR